VKQVAHDTEEKLMILTTQGLEEILGAKEEIIKDVVTTKDASQNFIEAWRSTLQA
jgi:hypothetical protein